MSKIYEYPAEEVFKDIQEIHDYLVTHEYPIAAIFMIAAGGCILGTALKNKFGLPYEIIRAKSYNDRRRDKLIVDYPELTRYIGKTVLVCDDLVDSGTTLTEVCNTLVASGIFVNTVTLIQKQGTMYYPDFAVKTIDQNVWIKFPWE